MPARKDFDNLLNKNQTTPLQLRRGMGVELTVHSPDAEIEETAKPSTPAPKPPLVVRESAKVDKRLIKAYKTIAAQEDRNLYEVMEEALRYWLEIHKGNNGDVEK